MGKNQKSDIFYEKQFGCYLCLRIYFINKNDVFFYFFPFLRSLAYRNKKGSVFGAFF